MADGKGKRRRYAALKPIVANSEEEKVKSKIIIEKKRAGIDTPQLVISFAMLVIMYLFIRYSLEAPQEIAIIVAGIFFGFTLFTMFSVVFLEQFERAVVQRFGRFNRVAGPGWIFIIPGMETYNVVDVRVKTLDLMGYEAITKDKIRLYLDIVVYAKIVDPFKAVLMVKDINQAIITFLKSITRETTGNLTAEEVISNVAKVNELLIGERDRLKDEWGVDLISVEIQEIRLPHEVQESMHDLRSAEYQRQVIEQKAYAREAMINAIQRAASKLDNPSLSYMYLDALQKVADGKATKIIFPMELTRLAENVSKNFGVNKEKFLDDIMKAYQETVAKDLNKK